MQNGYRLITIFSALIIYICVARAEENNPISLNSVEITSERGKSSSYKGFEIDSAELRNNIAHTMADILSYNSSAYVKNYGRATLTTVSFRGTSSSHTMVKWNGININSPMAGTSDISLIPAFFVDKAEVKEGALSVSETSGGLGAVVSLKTDTRKISDGFSGQFVQGIGSWLTVDDFLKLNFGKDKLRSSIRLMYSTSRNDFSFINHDKKENIYDDEHNIVKSYHPREKNRSGAYCDFNGMFSLSYNDEKTGLWSADIWYTNSNRQLPILTTDYSNLKFDNRQREQTIRGIVSWKKYYSSHDIEAFGGYIHSNQKYDYTREIALEVNSIISRARSIINTYHTGFNWHFYPSSKIIFSIESELIHNNSSSYDYANIYNKGIGYNKKRFSVDVCATVRWQPSSHYILWVILREETINKKILEPASALYMDYFINKKNDLKFTASVTRNYRYPTLNDLFNVPGGNPNLKPEKGISYDLGVSKKFKFSLSTLNLDIKWFDSFIDNWIMWLPSPKGFYVPRNVRKVHSSGIETRVSADIKLPRKWNINIGGNYSYTSSINKTPVANSADKSYGKQLPYIPLHSASFNINVIKDKWSLLLNTQVYSERYTMSSNETTITNRLPLYSVSNLSLDRKFLLKSTEWQAKITLNNIFNSDYQTVLSRPMPGINFEFFISISW